MVSLAFAGLLLASVALQFTLLARQMGHVRRHRSEVPAAFANTVDTTAHQKAADYTAAKARLNMLELAFGAAVALGWTLLGGLEALIHVANALAPGGIAQQLWLAGLFVGVGFVLELPWSAWRTFHTEAQFGFNRSSWHMWLGDQIKSVLLGLALMLPLAALALWILQMSGSWGWVWIWLLLVGFAAVMMVVAPIWIAPLFNRFTPLTDQALAERVQRLMDACGFAFKGVFVMDGSRRSAHANAYFTGLGRSKRVVLYDTLLKQLSSDELLAVLAHELGHFHHRHITQRMVGMAVQALVGLGMLGWLSEQAWFYSGLGVTPPMLEPQPMVAILLFSLVTPVIAIWLNPLQAAWSRHHEYQADAYAAAHASAAALQSALVKLHRDNAATLTPDPVYVRFHHSHPTASERLARLDPECQT